MRFKQFLSKTFKNGVYNNKTKEEIFSLLKKDCISFINELNKCAPDNGKYYWGHIMFLRGIKHHFQAFKKIKTRTNRKPLDTPLKIHNKFNEKLKEKFGWYPRREGVFATSDYSQSDIYGKSYLFFPIGQYKYVYLKKISDPISDLQSKKYIYYDDDEIKYNITVNDKQLDKQLDYYVSLSTDKNLCQSIGEVSFKCKEYYLIDNIYAMDIIKEFFE